MLCDFSKAFFLVLLINCIFAIATSEAQPSQTGVPQVLILNSYHPGYPWSDNELVGIVEALKQGNPQLQPAIEYMDFKHFGGETYSTQLKEFYQFKYQRMGINLVIAIDNLALDFALKYRAKLFPTAAIVFCGVNDFTDQMIEGQLRVTGVAERLDPEGTVKTALKFHPKTREIVVIHDYTKTGIETWRCH